MINQKMKINLLMNINKDQKMKYKIIMHTKIYYIKNNPNVHDFTR